MAPKKNNIEHTVMTDPNSCTEEGNRVNGISHEGSKSERHDEELYLEAVQQVIDRGYRKSNRTGIDTLSIFGMQMR